MNFNLNSTIEILDRTPTVLSTLLTDISGEWTTNNEGGQSWTVTQVIAHLVHCEKTSWMNRIDVIVSDDKDKKFTPIDRLPDSAEPGVKSLSHLLFEFLMLRQSNIQKIKRLNIKETDFSKTGIHPAFGSVTLSQLLATWAVHDLDHLAQISRVMAKQYSTEVGPWVEYLKILKT